jgi:hypothetical protein
MDIPRNTPAPAGATNKRVVSMRIQTFKLSMLLPVVAAGLLSPAAQAQQTFRAYGGLALTNYSIKFDNNAPNFGGGGNYQNKTAKADYLAPIVGVTWVSPQRIYVDASYQTSLSSDHDLWTNITSQKQDFSRSSYTVTGGYVHVLTNGNTISGFGGLTGGKSKLKAPRPPLTWSEDVFTSNGVFAGAAWGMPALGGSISISGAIALMRGKWTGDDGYLAEADSTVGFSVGAGYTYRITPAWGVTADLKIQNYSYTFNPPGTALDYKVKENTAALGARVSYQF